MSMFIGSLGRYIKSKATPNAFRSTAFMEGAIVDKGFKHAKGVYKGVQKSYSNYQRQKVITRDYSPSVPKSKKPTPMSNRSVPRTRQGYKKYVNKKYIKR